MSSVNFIVSNSSFIFMNPHFVQVFCPLVLSLKQDPLQTKKH